MSMGRLALTSECQAAALGAEFLALLAAGADQLDLDLLRGRKCAEQRREIQALQCFRRSALQVVAGLDFAVLPVVVPGRLEVGAVQAALADLAAGRDGNAEQFERPFELGADRVDSGPLLLAMDRVLQPQQVPGPA